MMRLKVMGRRDDLELKNGNFCLLDMVTEPVEV